MKAIEVDNLTVKYQSNVALSDVTFELELGHYLGIVGPNGSGKSTMVKALLGLVDVAEGEVRLCGTPIGEFREWARIGYMPQVSNRIAKGFPACVREIVVSGRLTRKRFPRSFNRTDYHEVDRVLAMLGIEELSGRMIGQLSGGQQQRVFLARALVADPEILILDEPTVALDPVSRERFYGTLQRLNKEEGKTIILITHDSGTIGQYANRMVYLDRRLIFFGSFQDFCESSTMTGYFGEASQHLICHRHDHPHDHTHAPDTPEEVD